MFEQFINLGYDMNSWLEGKPFVVNRKYVGNPDIYRKIILIRNSKGNS